MVRPNYDHIEMLDCGLMKVSMNGKIGLLNDIGKEILPLKYDSITAFKEGYALLFSNGAFCAIIDTQGHIINVALINTIQYQGIFLLIHSVIY